MNRGKIRQIERLWSMEIKDIIKKIEKVKEEEYGYFGETKTTEKDLLLIQHSEHFGFQRACDRIIHDLREIEL